jgi:hypothetical protein
MQIKLKPLFTFDQASSPPCVRSELLYSPLDPDTAALVSRLVFGIEASEVTPEEFKLLEKLNEQGLITFFDHPMHGVVGLHGVELRTALELLNNITVAVTDQTGQHRDYFVEALTDLGVKVVDADPALTIIISDSYSLLPDATGPVLPVILNRFRPSVGPLQTEWRDNIATQTKANVAYMVEPNVKLPKAFNDLQRAWAVANIYQFIIRTETAKVGHVIEFNMLKMKQDWWPVQL